MRWENLLLNWMSPRRSALLAGAAALAFTASIALADIVTLTDGTTLTGTLHKTDDGWTVTDANGTVTSVSADRVASIQVTSAKPAAEQAADRLQSLRNSVANSSDLEDIIRRYEAFIAKYQDTPAAADAMSDLQTWQGRQARGEVKLGKNWITPDQRDAIVAKSLAGAIEARELMSQGRPREADSVLSQALADDPENITALFLRGLIYFDAGKMPEARQCFEAVLAATPEHAPTLNNLAAVMFRQKQYGGSLTMYDRAMASLPMNKAILDNVAEAFHALPADLKSSIPATRAAQRFATQDVKLQAIMSQSGWYRWGATWVNQKQYDALQAADAQVKQQMADLQKRFDALTDQITTIDQSIATNNRSLRQIEANSWGRDANGNYVQFSYPQTYYDIQQDNTNLAQQRQQLVGQQQGLSDQAAQVQQSLPTPKFVGIQSPMGPEYAPIPASISLPPTAPPGNGNGAVAPAAPMPGPPQPATSQPASVAPPQIPAQPSAPQPPAPMQPPETPAAGPTPPQ